MRARWGLIPRWDEKADRGPRPTNARSEVVATNGMFKYAYRYGRALKPIDSHFEWKAIRAKRRSSPVFVGVHRRKARRFRGIRQSDRRYIRFE
jgi:putative SOS response-associated peptidase YedK